MCDSSDGSIELLVWKFIGDVNAILTLCNGGIGPGVIDSDVDIIFLQGIVDIYNLGIATVGTVLLEGEAEDENLAIEYLNAFLEHQFNGFGGDIFAHTVVHPAASKDNLGVIAIALGALGEVVGVNADAVTSDESWTEGQEVPLGASSLKDVEGVDTHLVEDLAQLIDESDIDVTLAVLNDLGSLGYLDGGSEVGAGSDNAAIDLVDIFAYLGSRARGDFFDVLYGMQLVTWVDALGAIASVEIDIHLHSTDFLDNGDAVVLGNTWIDGGLIDYDIAFGDDLADSGGGTNKRGEVGVVVGVNGGGDCHNIEIAVANLLDVGGADEAVVVDGVLQEVIGYLEGSVMACHEGINTCLVHVETDGGVLG